MEEEKKRGKEEEKIRSPRLIECVRERRGINSDLILSAVESSGLLFFERVPFGLTQYRTT